MPSNTQLSHGGTHPSRGPRGPFRRFTYRFAVVLLVVLGTSATVSCERPVEPDANSVSLTIAPTSATVAQGTTATPVACDTCPVVHDGSQRVTATLTRLGGVSGSVNLTVSGAPSGITAAVSNVQTTGAVTTATLTIVVGAGVAVGVYPLVVHGTGSGVSEVTQAFRLTVTAPPAVGSYTLTVTPSTVGIRQGQDSALPVYLVRTNFTGAVRLSVENLPTGVRFAQWSGPISGSFAQLRLAVAADAPTGTFTNVLVRGVAAGLADQTAPLTLTITPVPFTLSLSPATLSIVQGAAAQTTTVNIVRDYSFTEPVTLQVDWYEGLPPGITGGFTPSVTGGNTSVLSLSADAAAVPGVYDLYVYGYGTSTREYCCVPLRLTVVSP